MPGFFYRSWPRNWRDILGDLVVGHGWSRTDALALDDAELNFWLGQMDRIAEAQKDL